MKKHKLSKIVPSQLFKDLDLMKVDDEQEFKKRVSKHFNIPFETILTYDEMMQIPDKGVPKYNALITSNDGDDAAERGDIKGIYILIH